MPSASATTIVSAIREALQLGQATATLTSPLAGNPRTFYVSAPDGPFELWVYIWTLTPGGRAQLPNEYRIQMTGVRSPLRLNLKGPTLLLGYYPETGYFAGFDLERHHEFTEGSPSVQISITALEEARGKGLALALKENAEVAIGIRPDHLLNYTRLAPYLHAQNNDEATTKLLADAATVSTHDESRLGALSDERQRIVREVSALSRDSRFRKSVLAAYNHRCAATGMRLNLLDAAHILPVTAPGSTDEVTNGITLSPTIHRAFDNGLIYIDESYAVRVNEEQLDDLRRAGRDQGWTNVQASLRSMIYLPDDPILHPDIEKIQKANLFRGIIS